MRTPRDLSRGPKSAVPAVNGPRQNPIISTNTTSPSVSSVPHELIQTQVQTISQLERQIAELQSKLDLSRRAFDNLVADRDEDLTKAHDTGRAMGHGEVLSELEDLWRSQHFCLELLYGKKIHIQLQLSRYSLRGADLTEKQYTHVLRLLSSTYVDPPPPAKETGSLLISATLKKRRAWLRRRMLSKFGPKFQRMMPGPISYKTLQQFADHHVRTRQLTEMTSLNGVTVSLDKLIEDLVAQLPNRPTHIDLQLLGDGFRAMRKIGFVNIGVRILQEDTAINNSFSSLATL